MIDVVIRAALLQRDPYLRMLFATDGVADGAIVVAVAHAIRVVPAFIDGIDVLNLFRYILGGMFGWIILSGLIYLIGRRLLEGSGTFPGVMAATSLAYAPLLLSATVLGFVIGQLQADLIASAWFLAALWMATRVSLELERERAALAVGGGWLAWFAVRLIFSF